VITSVSIKNLRGIRDGTLEGLTSLTVLVGPNSSGKSTILDALLIGASPSTANAVGAAVRRREGVRRGARWLFWRGGDQCGVSVAVRTDAGVRRRCELSIEQATPAETVLVCKSQTFNDAGGEPSALVEWAQFQPGNAFNARNPTHTAGPLPGVSEIRLVEPHGGPLSTPMSDLYSRAVQRGRRADVKDLVAAIVPGVQAIEILTDEGEPVVHMSFADHSVPVGLLGDGIQSLLRQSFELATLPGGVVLLEEPEVHEHPSAIWQTARAISASVRRGAQVILTTHSLELVDGLLAALAPGEIAMLSLYRLKLADGVLQKSRLDGEDVSLSRGDVGDDLR
jgi:hypothetical protein